MTSKSLRRFSYTVLVGPTILIYSLVIVFPVLVSLVLSFTQWSGFGPPKFVGLENFITMFKDSVFYIGLRNNALVVAISLFGQIPLGFILAYFIYRRLVHAGKFFEVMIFLPITISQIVVAILWNRIFTPIGMLTQLLRGLFHDPNYAFLLLQNPTFAMVPILFVILWMYTGLYMIIFLANLQKIPLSTIEAAVIDGAREGQILGRIIIPEMIGVLFTASVLAISGSLTSFALIYAMTNGGPAHFTEVVAIYMYYNTFSYYKYGFGSAVSIIIVVLSMGLISVTRGIANVFERKFG
jgi:multiple sugar transport system permease protein/raffinose/stachyose/melibiose transport system permease protein